MARSPQLNELQLDFLKLMSKKDLSASELDDIKLMVAQYFLKKADEEMDRIWVEKNLSPEAIEVILQTDLHVK